MSQHDRLEMALSCFCNPANRLRAQKIWESEKPCSIFWDKDERQIEFISDNREIIIREHSSIG